MLHRVNEEILHHIDKIKKDNNLSGPLLVSSNKEFVNTIKKNKNIMYIGQETNGWLNEGYVFDYEKLYKDFLYENNYNREFWKFLRLIIEKNQGTKLDNVIWANALICGKKDELGTPKFNDKLESISIHYLVYLYKYFKPDMTVIVSGPNNPYYEIIKEFLNKIDSKLSGEYSDTTNYIVSDKDKNIYYTYHPNYLNRKGKLLTLSKELNQIYKNI